jgi:hypothetical protein
MNDTKAIEYFRHKGQLVGMCIRGTHAWDKTGFLTPDENYQQVGLLHYPGGHAVKPHAHHKVDRTVRFTQEVLFCVSGRIVYTFYDAEDNWSEICSCEITANDVLCLFGAGHGARALEPTRLIEIKQGPFMGAADKFYYPDKPGQ